MYIETNDIKLDTSLTEVSGEIFIVDSRQNENSSKTWYRGTINFHSCDTQNQEFKTYIAKRGLVQFTYLSSSPPPQHATVIGNVNRKDYENGAYALSLDAKLVLTEPLTYQNIESLLIDSAKSYDADKELIEKLEQYESRGLSPTNAFLELSRASVSDNLRYVLQDVLGSENDLMESLIISQLQPYVGKNNNFARDMYRVYGIKAYKAMCENPWEMMLTVRNMGLQICDKIAEALNIPISDPRRLNTLLIKTINRQITELGSTYLTDDFVNNLYDSTFAELYSFDDFQQALKSEHITHIDIGYQPANIYNAEQTIYRVSKALATQSYSIDTSEIIEKLHAMQTFAYTDKQQEAIKQAINSKLFLLTGGPGVGKTTVLDGILKAHRILFGYDTKQIVCMSPTGKAAQRMTEQTGLPASTIHSKLQITPGALEHDLEPAIKALKADDVQLIVVDEASMLDTILAGSLFEVVDALDCDLIIIGDVDQLPSIGPGQVFSDLLSTYPHVRLTEVKRQTDQSNILKIANMVLNGEFPDIEWFKDKPDLFFVPQNNTSLLSTLANKVLMPKQDELGTFQILTPYYKNYKHEQNDTVSKINTAVQPVFNTTINQGEDENPQRLHINGNYVYINDRVICRQNRNKFVVNGSLGYVKKIDTDGDFNTWSITVDFNGYLEIFNSLDFDDLELAYAMTIHKSQGSEYATVIIPIVRQIPYNNNFLTKNLLYTALTRAKDRVVFMGNINSFKTVAKTQASKRKTGLYHLLNR